MLYNENLEMTFKHLKKMVSSDIMLNDPDCKILFRFHTYASEKQFGAIFSQSIKPITFLLQRIGNDHHKYTTN